MHKFEVCVTDITTLCDFIVFVLLQRLSQDEKESYKVETKNFEPVDSFGVPLSEHAAALERAKKMKEDMINGIKNMVAMHLAAEGMFIEFTFVRLVNSFVTMK